MLDSIKKFAKLILINVLVFILLLSLCNILSVVIYKTYHYLGDSSSTAPVVDARAQLPNYQDHEWAADYFVDEKGARSEYRSFIGWRHLPYESKTINISEQGLRITPQSPKVNEHSDLVVFLGGSTMWGQGVNDAHTIPACFSRIAQGKCRTENYGEQLYNAFQSYMFLKLQMMQGARPDVVVSYDGVNERKRFAATVCERFMVHPREEQMIQIMRGADSEAHTTLQFSDLIAPTKTFLGIVLRRLGLREPAQNREDLVQGFCLDEETMQEKAHGLLQTWRMMQELAQKHGARFYPVLQPNAYTGSPVIDHLDLDQDEKELLYERFYSTLRELIASPQYADIRKNFIDLSHIFDSDERYYIDYCHVTLNGNERIARALYERIYDE